ncbi:60S ribosomal protein L22 [Halotydeus destructor]|nr:60S ribosomal protein L22 [Halotydeus destructor]
MTNQATEPTPEATLSIPFPPRYRHVCRSSCRREKEKGSQAKQTEGFQANPAENCETTPGKGKGVKQGKKCPVKKVVVDCSRPVEDGIMISADFEKYLHERIKVNGKTGNLSNSIVIERTKTKVTIIAEIPFSKRYIKYLTRRYLQKHNLRDWLRVVATNNEGFELRYFQINNEDDEEEDDNE